jgi:thiol-disulfide isomerase/thioredoxin
MMLVSRPAARRFRSWLIGACLSAIASSIAFADSRPKNFVVHEAPKPIPTIAFEDEQGRQRSLADFRGKVVLLNIWATWCVPCRKEMPALDRLQAALGGQTFEIVALSIDRGGLDVVRKFFAEIGIRNLAIYLDTSAKVWRELGAVGLPTTLLIDRDGGEIGRLIGPAEWDAPEMAGFVRCVVSRDDARESKPSTTRSCDDTARRDRQP